MGKITTDQLSVREQKFADAVLLGKSAGEADIVAGFSARSSRTEGPRRLQKPAIQAYIQRHQEQRAQKTLSLKERLDQELELMAFARIAPLVRIDEEGLPQVDWTGATEDQLAAVTSVATKRRTIYNPKGEVVGAEDTSKFTMADKYRGIELLAKLNGLLTTDKVEVVVDVADRLLRARQRALSGPDSEET